jgi:two-component system response regulator RegX3
VTKVLVVEDETSYSEALSYVLRKEGFEVAIAETGPDALTEFDRNGADIVLLDLMLPGLSGTEVCRALRQVSSVPIIMVSAKDTEVDKVVGLELGADDYVPCCAAVSPTTSTTTPRSSPDTYVWTSTGTW